MIAARRMFSRAFVRALASLLTGVLTGVAVAPGCAPAGPDGGSKGPSAPISPGEGVSESTPPSDQGALADLDRGERIIAVAGGDCAAACEALSVIVRARVRLCSPATSSCTDAERREGAASKQVSSFCDVCAPVAPAPASSGSAAP